MGWNSIQSSVTIGLARDLLGVWPQQGLGSQETPLRAARSWKCQVGPFSSNLLWLKGLALPFHLFSASPYASAIMVPSLGLDPHMPETV